MRAYGNCVLSGEPSKPQGTLRDWLVAELDHAKKRDNSPYVQGRIRALSECLYELTRREQHEAFRI